MKRILTALVIVPVLVAVIGYAPAYCFLLLVAIAATLALDEFFSIASKSGLEVFRLPGHLCSVLLLASFYFSPGNTRFSFLVLVSAGLLFLSLGLNRANPLAGVLSGASATLLGVVYISGTLGLMVALRLAETHWGAGSQWIFFLLVVVWFGDTGAYYLGRALGRHPLATRISPKKTVEGAIGGVLGNLLAAMVGKQLLLPAAPLSRLVLLSVALGLVSQIGDLAESALKRGAGVKDSSNLLPGHGGMLDRIDGVLFASPLIYGYVRFLF